MSKSASAMHLNTGTKSCFCSPHSSGPTFMALLTADSAVTITVLNVQAPNFCASCIREECLVTWSPLVCEIHLKYSWNSLCKHCFFACCKQSHEIGPRCYYHSFLSIISSKLNCLRSGKQITMYSIGSSF